ncbi:MAG: hypothetical protein QW470_03645 [Candidatus Caldarchaeum sp.]
MSGFGVLVSLAYVTMIVLQFTVYMFTSMDHLIEMSRAIHENMDGRNSFEIKLVEVNGRYVRLDLTNKGPKDIRLQNLNASDLIIVYFDNSSTRKVRWIGYQPNPVSGLSRWYITGVATDGFSGELVDPIILPAGVEGVWNRGETLKAVVELDETINVTLPVYVVFKVVE